MKNDSSRSLWLCALLFIAAGVNHFVFPAPYMAMMPRGLPHPSFLHLAAGVAEIAGGIGLLIPRLRRAAGWGLIALLIAVFPANWNVAWNGWPNGNVPSWILWARLPLQPLLIWWVYRIAVTPPSKPKKP